MDPSAPLGGWFTPARHGLTLEQCRVANRLLRQRNQAQPIRGASPQARFRRAQRHAGILSAVKNGRVGNSHFGYRLHGHRGGRVMAMHGAHILARNREGIQARRQALRAWQQRQPKTPFEAWQRSLTAEPWEQEPPQDFMPS
jgi:hypothetical protein